MSLLSGRSVRTAFLCCKELVKSTERRWFFSKEHMKLDSYEKKRNIISDKMGHIKDKFMLQLTNMIESQKGVVFKGDLQLLLFIATSNELDIVEQILVRYVTQQTYTSESAAGDGANLMRLCHYTNEANFSVGLFNNETLRASGMFSDTAKCILSDMLFESGSYDRISELSKDWVTNDNISSHLYSIIQATFLKQNTRESYERMMALPDMSHNPQTWNGLYLGALLALRQNEPASASAMLAKNEANHLPVVKALVHMWADAETGMLNNFLETIDERMSSVVSRPMPIYLKLLEQKSFTLDRELIERIRAALSRHEDQEKRDLCLKKLTELESFGVLGDTPIEDIIIKRFGVPRQPTKEHISDSENLRREDYA